MSTFLSLRRQELSGLVILLGVTVCLGVSQRAQAGGLVCPGRCVGGDNHGERCFSVAECPGVGAVCEILERCVYVEWRPSQVVVPPGAVAEVHLWAYSSDGFTIPLEGSDILLTWDPTRLQLLGIRDPCRVCAGGSNAGNLCNFDTDCPGSTCVNPGLCFDQCPPQTYNWFTSFFPNDCAGDALNDPCIAGQPPANDGDARYQNFRQLACGADPADPAMVPPLGDGTGGLHLTTFQFQPLIAEGGATVDIPLELGLNSFTGFFGGSVPGLNILGLIGQPVQIIVAEICDPPTVTASGGRYIDITPPPGGTPVALLVEGSASDPDVSCVSMYVNMFCEGGANDGQPCQNDSNCGTGTCTDARLGNVAQFRTPAEWGTVALTGIEIIPETVYNVRTDCGPVQGNLLSNPVSVTTQIWGDTDPTFDGFVNFVDISTTVDAFQQRPGVSIQATDLMGTGCNPDRTVNFLDISANLDGFQGIPYGSNCPSPCP